MWGAAMPYCRGLAGWTEAGADPAAMAWHYKEYQHEQTTHDRLVYRDEEESARVRRVGLWKDAKPVPPWEWRKGDRAKR
jgi:endonuclease YncB( thermonuclease family)